MSKVNIKNLGLGRLKEEFLRLGLEKYRPEQVKKWLYQKEVGSFAEMTNLKKGVKELLDSHFEIPRLEILGRTASKDGTIKFLIRLPDGDAVESVLIPSVDLSEGSKNNLKSPRRKRNTLCISSQVGCAMGCRFCLTGAMGFRRNLTVFEIVDQVGAVTRALAGSVMVTNIVFMGMGEPLANPENLFLALEILQDQSCYGFSRQHITVSTSGLAPQIEGFGGQTAVKLAVSLNATTDEVRSEIMPINKKYPIKRLIRALEKMHLPKRNRITFEYVLLHKTNDSMEDAHRLVGILSNLKAKINLIPFNSFPGSPYRRPPDDHIFKFQKVLLDKGFVANIRSSRGSDILGACGQLVVLL